MTREGNFLLYKVDLRELGTSNIVMLAQHPKTLEGKVVLGFFTLPWAPKGPWTLKDGSGTRNENNHSKYLYSNYKVLRALCQITRLILTTVRSRFYCYPLDIDEETEAEF